MAFCANCGKEIADDAVICVNCGVRVEKAPEVSLKKESTWTGGVLETLVAGIVFDLIIIFTCGIGTPWAITYMIKFIIDRVVIDGKKVTFDGTGMQLLGNWIKWYFLTIITCGIYSFWVTPRLYRWVASHIHIEEA